MPQREHQLATSVLVVGTGGAGLRAAIELAEAGVAVLAVGKRPVDDAHTALAAGGISAALATTDAADTWEQHAADTLQESCLLADPRAVERVARDAGRAIHDLERFGMRFDRQADGRIAQRWFGAHTYRRTAFAGEHTGLELQRVLSANAVRLGVPVLSTCYVTRLLVDHGSVFGAYGFDLVDGSRYLLHADAVILAAGGHTRIWRRTSARRDESTGDSFRLAVEAGVRLRDPEFVQFHPSGLLEPENAAGILVSETARSEGGVLLNNLGERYLARYDPVRMERASREVVARASYTEIAEGRGSHSGGVWLDLSHLPRETILSRLPQVYQTLLDVQMLDVTRDPIEVAPTAHYSVGGARYDRTTTARRSRDSSSSARRPAVSTGPTGSAATPSSSCWSRAGPRRGRRPEPAGPATGGPQPDGSVRRRRPRRGGLTRGLDRLDEVETRAGDVGVHIDISGFQDVAHAFDLRSATLAGRATLECARERRESRGCHQRSDHPDQDPALEVNLLWSPTEGVRRAAVPPVPTDIAALMHEVSDDGKLLE
jgi:succinate dehydrogenase / fumarate reductase, flavoprotein subunit